MVFLKFYTLVDVITMLLPKLETVALLIVNVKVTCMVSPAGMACPL